MEENKKENPNKTSNLGFKSDADSGIERSGLNQVSDDEEDLSKARAESPFKLFLTRSFIRLKNHIAINPLILSCVTCRLFTFNIPTHVNAIVILSNYKRNAILFFINVVASFRSVLVYLNASSRKASKKRFLLFFALFTLITALSLVLDFIHLNDIHIESGLYNDLNAIKDEVGYVVKSKSLTITHVVLLLVTYGLAFLSPILQPFCKKIHLHRKKKEA